MALKKYSEKRNFRQTSEPKPKVNKPGKALVFVVQRHDASHLHYDFRLEMEGVLKSWAVPKGPSMNSADKRLAMMVEDHPFEYRKFYGTIPEGNYGAGEVEIWDEGTYTPIQTVKSVKDDEKELLKELKAGSLKIVLNGTHLKGEFALVKIKNQNDKKDNAWLLIKHKDKFEIKKNYAIENYTSIHRPGKRSAAKKEKKAKPAKQDTKEEPAETGRTHVRDYIKPMLAKQADKPFDDEDWIFEIKYDGYRAIAETGKELKFYSRNGLSFISQYPEITNELRKIKSNLVLDGEVVAMDEKGVPSFQLLQNYQGKAASLAYYVFDILKKDKKDLTGLPLTERKNILKQSLKTNSLIRYSDDIAAQGKKFFELSTKRNLEGIMGKRADSTYQPGIRTNNWLKIKNHKQQEVVIAGFTQPRKTRKYFGALVLGIYQGKQLVYCGHTGTGFDESGLKTVYEKLIKIKQKESPFNERVVTNAPVTWVKPVLVCEIKYTEITGDGIMRHPVFMGLREDKKAADVVNENKNKINVKKEIIADKKNTRVEKAVKPLPKKISRSKDTIKNNEEKEISDKVKLTNQSKVYFPKDKITKGDIANYYQSMADYILPYLKNRPQSLYRSPNGIAGPGFFQKDMLDVPTWLKTEKIFSESNNKNINYLICNDRTTLAYMNNLGCIELNPWHSRIGSLDNPDYIAIDLDPSPKNTFEQVVETALAVKQVFDKAGVETYCKTSGATGIHIYAPLSAKYTYDQVKDFVNLVAIKAAELVPDFTSLERSLKKRGNKIYIDYMQNRGGQTLASVYSVRPKPGATVSTPLEWKEVKKGLDPRDFTVKNTQARIKKKGDLFSGVLGKGIDLRKCLSNLE